MEAQAASEHGARVAKDAVGVQVGARIRWLRKQAGLSIEALAHRAEIAPPYLSNVERGAQNPSLAILARLADGLRLPLARLVDVSEPTTPAELRRELRARAAKLDAPRLEILVRVAAALDRPD